MSDLPTSKELVKSLRDYSEGPTFYWGPICQKAAEEIERLQRELAASAAQYQEACDDANRFARERDEARASPEPSEQLKNAPENFNTADGVKADGYQPDQEWMNAGLGEYSTPPPSADIESLIDSLVQVVRRDNDAGDQYTRREVTEARAELLAAARPAPPPATEHPPQLMAVVDQWQDNANRWREMTPHRERKDAALVDLILREIRETIAPSSSVTKEGAQ